MPPGQPSGRVVRPMITSPEKPVLRPRESRVGSQVPQESWPCRLRGKPELRLKVQLPTSRGKLNPPGKPWLRSADRTPVRRPRTRVAIENPRGDRGSAGKPRFAGKKQRPAPGSRTRGVTRNSGQSADSMKLTRAPLGFAPATELTGWPPLKRVSVGTDITR